MKVDITILNAFLLQVDEHRAPEPPTTNLFDLRDSIGCSVSGPDKAGWMQVHILAAAQVGLTVACSEDQAEEIKRAWLDSRFLDQLGHSW